MSCIYPNEHLIILKAFDSLGYNATINFSSLEQNFSHNLCSFNNITRKSDNVRLTEYSFNLPRQIASDIPRLKEYLSKRLEELFKPNYVLKDGPTVVYKLDNAYFSSKEKAFELKNLVNKEVESIAVDSFAVIPQGSYIYDVRYVFDIYPDLEKLHVNFRPFDVQNYFEFPNLYLKEKGFLRGVVWAKTAEEAKVLARTAIEKLRAEGKLWLGETLDVNLFL